MTEYIIVLALVAISAIGVYQFYGQVVRSQTVAMAQELAGQNGTNANKVAQDAAQNAEQETHVKTLQSFTGNAGE